MDRKYEHFLDIFFNIFSFVFNSIDNQYNLIKGLGRRREILSNKY